MNFSLSNTYLPRHHHAVAPRPLRRLAPAPARQPAGLSERSELPAWAPHLPPLPTTPRPLVAQFPPPRLLRAPSAQSVPVAGECPPYVEGDTEADRVADAWLMSLQPLFRQLWLEAPVAARAQVAERSPLLSPLVHRMEAYAHGHLPWQWLSGPVIDCEWAQAVIAVVVGEGIEGLLAWLSGALDEPGFCAFVARQAGPQSPSVRDTP